MVRSFWAGALAGALACAAPGWAQPPQAAKADTKPAVKADAKADAERVVTVKEAGKPAQKCRVLRCWTQKDGSRVCEVQDIDSGEKLTILEEVAGTNKKSLAQIFRWGKSPTVPAGVPVAPRDAVLVGAPVAAKPSLKSRMFGQKAQLPVSTEPPKAEPRESWGKLERWTAADSDKAVQTASARAEGGSKRPVAAKTGADPLMMPEVFTPPVAKTEPAKSEVVTTTTTVVSEGQPRPTLMSRLRGMRMTTPAAAPAKAGMTGPGMGSVMAATSPQMAREMDMVMTMGRDGQPVLMPRSEASPKMVAVDVSAPNAFSTPMPARMPAAPPMHMNMPPMMMPGGGTMMAGMSMAPSYPGMMHGQAMMVPMQPPMPMVPMTTVVDAGMAHTAGLMQQLTAGELPSQREMAADQLSRVNWRMEPAVVQALMHAAKADPAPMVRASCVQALAKMKANTVPVVQAVNACKQDADTRVRQAAEQALAELMAP